MAEQTKEEFEVKIESSNRVDALILTNLHSRYSASIQINPEIASQMIAELSKYIESKV